ncbi:C2H2 domain containing protein [Lasiodiplodia theobromae]|uniref:C2H2 domain containing protein n=1 Tax=Lasiodiplodia theobromae TaxID=45133 RepID=UPI0015C2C44F|nr:C2H2 domain containing protein [Lasiodiplodia theobromae]KAF4541801.1 C2H2 domain containing protein [Lasiodiplodia theobromae]
MTSGFNKRFALQHEQRETSFSATSVGAGIESTPADDGIDHALLQDLLFEDSSAGYHAYSTSISPLQSQGYYDSHEANSFPSGTCTLAMLELNHFPTPVMGAEAGNRNVFAPTAEPRLDFRVSTDLVHGFGEGSPLDGSAFPLSTDLSADQPDYVLGGNAQQTGATPSFYVGGQPRAGVAAAVRPIGSNEDSERSTAGSTWEMRDNKYFCLHPGCRNPSFKRLGDLERHQNNVHAQTKFFWCRYSGCERGRSFPRKDKRNEHERKVHHVDYTLAENI